MIKVENIKVFNIEGAIRGMRNPMNSWLLSDSKRVINDKLDYDYEVGPKDLELMKKLYKAGTEHRKYLRQIMCSMDITGPFFWWKEFSTYKIGTTANSCSTMHKLTSKPITVDDFSFDEPNLGMFKTVVDDCEMLRQLYVESKDAKIWRRLIQLLPESYNQKRTVSMNYENVMNMINQRSNHKLIEWREFCEILKSLPYVKEIRS